MLGAAGRGHPDGRPRAGTVGGRYDTELGASYLLGLWTCFAMKDRKIHWILK